MTANDFEQDVPASEYGAARRAAWLQHAADLAEAASSASLAAHQETHNVITRTTHGLYGALSGEQQAAILAARRPRVGDGTGSGRELVPLGGTDWESQGAGAVAPVPARVDLTRVGQHQPPGISPLLRHMQGLG